LESCLQSKCPRKRWLSPFCGALSNLCSNAVNKKIKLAVDQSKKKLKIDLKPLTTNQTLHFPRTERFQMKKTFCEKYKKGKSRMKRPETNHAVSQILKGTNK
jgi:hypothetical protein